MIVHLEISVSNRTGFSCPARQRDRCLFTGQALNFATWWDFDGLSRPVQRVQIRLVFLQFSSKLLKKFFWWKLTSIVTLSMLLPEGNQKGHRGRWKWSSIFYASHHSKRYGSQKLWSDKKKRIWFARSFTKKKFRKFW